MTSEALTELWEAEQRARRYETEYWRVADRLLDAGLVRIEDVGEIYGVHPQTAYKRLRAMRLGVPAKQADRMMTVEEAHQIEHRMRDKLNGTSRVE